MQVMKALIAKKKNSYKTESLTVLSPDIKRLWPSHMHLRPPLKKCVSSPVAG